MHDNSESGGEEKKQFSITSGLFSQTSFTQNDQHWLPGGMMGHMWTNASISLLTRLNILIRVISDEHGGLMQESGLFRCVKLTDRVY